MAEASPLESLIARVGSLYTLPAVAMEVLQLTENEQVDVRALKQCIERDPALAAKLLRVVNSSMFGLKGEVENLTQAIALLGIKPLKLLVLGFSLPTKLLADLDSQQLARYWQLALTRAVVARQLVESQWKAPGDEAFLVALLQDIGKLVLLQQVGTPYAKFLSQVKAEQVDLVKLEQHSLGFDHRALTVALLKRWSLPSLYADSIEYTPREDNTRSCYTSEASIPQVLELANLLVELVPNHRLHVLPELLEKGQLYCDLTSDDVSRLVAEIEPRVEQLASVLNVEIGDRQQMLEVLADAHSQMSNLTTDAAGILALNEDRLCDELLTESNELKQVVDDFMSQTNDARTGEHELTRADGNQMHLRGPRASSGEAACETNLLDQVDRQAKTCRQERTSLSLVCLEATRGNVDSFDTEATSVLHSAMQPWMDEFHLTSQQLVRTGNASYGVLLPSAERREAVEIAQRLASLVTMGGGVLNVNAGVASIGMIPKGWDAERLVSAAENCLTAARLTGGSAVKSIEVY